MTEETRSGVMKYISLLRPSLKNVNSLKCCEWGLKHFSGTVFRDICETNVHAIEIKLIMTDTYELGM